MNPFKIFLILLCFFCLTTSLVQAQKNTPDNPPESTQQKQLDKEPICLNLNKIKTEIGYPKEAVDRRIQGKVVTLVLVNEKGGVEKYEIDKDPSPVLTAAVVDRVFDLKFEPGKSNGKKIKVWITIPWDFQLSKPEKDQPAPSSQK